MATFNNTKGKQDQPPERPVKDIKQPPPGNQSIRKTDPSHQSFEREETEERNDEEQ